MQYRSIFRKMESGRNSRKERQPGSCRMKRDGWIQDNIIPDGCWKDLWMAQTGLYWKISDSAKQIFPTILLNQKRE